MTVLSCDAATRDATQRLKEGQTTTAGMNKTQSTANKADRRDRTVLMYVIDGDLALKMRRAKAELDGEKDSVGTRGAY